jgi:epoxide hydrolase
MRVESFTINIAQTTLDDVRERLARTRWPDEVEGAGSYKYRFFGKKG